MADGAGGEYAWERAYERTWDALEEDEHGRLTAASATTAGAGQSSGNGAALGAVRRGMLRHMVVVVDASAAMLASDLAPSRLAASATALTAFVKEWFDQNPVGSMALVAVRDSTAHVLSPLTATLRDILTPLASLGGLTPPGPSGTTPVAPAVATMAAGGGVVSGAFSLQAALEASAHELSLVPTQGLREIALVHAALSSVDAGDIWRTIQALDSTAVHVTALAGEVYITKKVAEMTKGHFGVAENYEHLTKLLGALVPPPPTLASAEEAGPATMVRMGFPTLSANSDAVDTGGRVRDRGYICPQCSSVAGDLPGTCAVCALQLVSAPQLIRSHHHMAPLAPFLPVPHASGASPPSEGQLPAVAVAQVRGTAMDSAPAPCVTVATDASRCAGCAEPLAATAPRAVCPRTLTVYCTPCDSFMHQQLHNNPAVL